MVRRSRSIMLRSWIDRPALIVENHRRIAIDRSVAAETSMTRFAIVAHRRDRWIENHLQREIGCRNVRDPEMRNRSSAGDHPMTWFIRRRSALTSKSCDHVCPARKGRPEIARGPRKTIRPQPRKGRHGTSENDVNGEGGERATHRHGSSIRVAAPRLKGIERTLEEAHRAKETGARNRFQPFRIAETTTRDHY